MEYKITTTCNADQLGSIISALTSAGISPMVETVAKPQASVRKGGDQWAQDPMTRGKQQAVSRKIFAAMGANPNSTSDLGLKLSSLSDYEQGSIGFFLRVWLREGLVAGAGHGKYRLTDKGRKWAALGPSEVLV